MANTEGIRLVRCPKCSNVLPEPANVTVYKCGGCGTTLRAKIRVSNGQNVATKQVRQNSEDFSVVTTVSNGVSPENTHQVTSGAAMDGSCTADAPSTEHDSNGTRSKENGSVMPTKNDAMEVQNTENNGHYSSEDQMECSADILQFNSDETHTDSGEAENRTVEQCSENQDTSKARDNHATEHHLDASENNMLSSEMSRAAAVSILDHEEKGAGEEEHAVNKRSYLIRAQSRSCDLRASGNSIDFQSARTSLQSQSFRAGEPLQSKIMNTVDELKGDLSELFSKPSDTKPIRAPPPRRPAQDGRMARAAVTTSAPLTAYHPGAKQSGPASRLSRSGQVPPPRGLPSPRYRRHRGYPSHQVQFHSEQMEMRPCRHDCCHSCRPPCYRSCSQEPAAAYHNPPAMEKKRRPPPRNHCRPVLRGAPFVICSRCLKLVELPTGFAVPSKGTRRLRCGSCSEILSYSYRDPSRKQKPQSPFGGDEYSTDGYELHQAADNAGGFHELGDPVSYSEEHALSFLSHSTSTGEDEQPLHVSRNSSFNTVDERIGRDGKLHRLMGYSSASELLLRRRSPDLFESFDGRMPDARTRVVVDNRKGKGVCVAESDDDAGERDGAAVVKRSKARGGGLPLHGLLKKGFHGLESLKLRS